MTELSQDEQQMAANELEEFQRLRGWIVNSYAQIEYILGDLILRCRQFSQYDELTQTLPHDATKRVKRIRAICLVEGPISVFAPQLNELLAQFEARHEIRNLMTHGFATYQITAEGDSGLSFQKWHRAPDRIDARLLRTFRLHDLMCERDQSVDLAQVGLKLFYRIHSNFGWVGAP